jgi:hypothetical protein
MRIARGEFLGFIDCDDVWTPGRLQIMLKTLSQDPGLDGTFGNVVNTDTELNPISSPVAAQLLGTTLLRRVSALRVGTFRTDITHAANIDWVSRAAMAGLRLRALDNVVLLRRIHGDNLGIQSRPGSREDLLRVVRDHHQRHRR